MGLWIQGLPMGSFFVDCAMLVGWRLVGLLGCYRWVAGGVLQGYNGLV